MRIGNVTLQHDKKTHHVGPVDVVSSRWTGRMGKKKWTRSRPTRVIDSETGDQVRVHSSRRIALGVVLGAAVITGAVTWLRNRR